MEGLRSRRKNLVWQLRGGEVSDGVGRLQQLESLALNLRENGLGDGVGGELLLSDGRFLERESD